MYAVDGEWTSWGEWSECSVSCGEGTRQRSLSCQYTSKECIGKDCNPGQDIESENCWGEGSGKIVSFLNT